VNELTKRISVALWGIPLLLLLTYMGGFYFLALVLIVNGMALWEFYTIYHNKQIYPYRVPGVVLSTTFLLITFFAPQYWESLVLMTIIYIFFVNLSKQEGLASKNATFTISGFVYITLFLSMLLYLRLNFDQWMPTVAANVFLLGFENWLPDFGVPVSPAGGRYIIVMLGSIWICDTAAYSGGRKLGKHKLAPNVSPNKTWEGAIFGLVFGILAFVLLGKLFLPDLPLIYTFLSGAVVGIFGQIGDLVESRFKRDAGVKDTSALLPGHGGFLDRFDSIIFVSPFLWALFYYAGGG
jgi:phosphatidate cytidylyltransferase